MIFEDWWMTLLPAEVDEIKNVFRQCWDVAQENVETTISEKDETEMKFSEVSKAHEELRAHNTLLIGAVRNLTDICITQVGSDYSNVIHAAYLRGMEALQADAQPEHTPVEPEEVYSPNTVILKV